METEPDRPEDAPARALKVPPWLGLPALGILWVVVSAYRIHGFGDRNWAGSFLFSALMGVALTAYLGLCVLVGSWRIGRRRRRRAERPWLDEEGRRKPRRRRQPAATPDASIAARRPRKDSESP